MIRFRLQHVCLTAPTALVVALALATPAVAQPPIAGAATTDWTLAGPATGNWNTTTNWSGGAVPDVNTQDFAVINNGGTAIVNTVIAQQAGGVSLGTNANESGTLQITSGGTLTVVDDGPTFPADGSVRIGQGGTGTLLVAPGGTLNSASLTLSGANANSSLTVGGTTAGTATITTGPVLLNRTTRIIGPNVAFNSSSTVTLQDTSTLVAQITGGTHSAIKAATNATLDGALQVQFSGVTPTASSTWNLVDSPLIGGNFTGVTSTGATLGLGQQLAVRKVAGGLGQVAQLYVNQLPVLSVNRGTGAVSLTNPGTSGIAIDGYAIQSALGALNTANWNSLQDQGTNSGAWSEANPTANHLAELRANGSTTLAGGQTLALGNIFAPPTPVAFGTNTEDLAFTYNATGVSAPGVVNYTGATGINNLVLFVDPATGNAKLRNTSGFTVAIDGYTIGSASGALRPTTGWNSLDDQNAGNGLWAEANVSANRLSELQSSGSTTLNLNGGTTFDLGNLFTTTGQRDLVFQFVRSTDSTPLTGVVLYQALSAGVAGDYNNNGTVDAADYNLYRDNLGQSVTLPNDSTPGTVTAADYTVWKNNFGMIAGASVAAATAVPEASTLLLTLLGVAAVARVRR